MGQRLAALGHCTGGVGSRQHVLAVLLLALLAVVRAVAETAAPPPAAAAVGAPQRFNSVYNVIMAMNETTFTKQGVISFLTSPRGLTPSLVRRFQYVVPISQSSQSTITAFVPVDTAWEELGRSLCMTLNQTLDYLWQQPEQVVTQTELFIGNTSKPLYSRGFRDGLALPTFNKGFKLLLREHNSSTPHGGAAATSWVLPGLSPNRSDIRVVRTDIKAGNSVVHLIDGIIMTDEFRGDYLRMRNESCSNSSRAGAAVSGAGAPAAPAGGLMAVLAAALFAMCAAAAAGHAS